MLSYFGAASQEGWESRAFLNPTGGYGFMAEIMGGKETRIRRTIRMSSGAFYTLRDWIAQHAGIQRSRTQTVSPEEKLFMFLWMANYGASNRLIFMKFLKRSFASMLRLYNSPPRILLQMTDFSTTLDMLDTSQIVLEPWRHTYQRACE